MKKPKPKRQLQMHIEWAVMNGTNKIFCTQKQQWVAVIIQSHLFGNRYGEVKKVLVIEK